MSVNSDDLLLEQYFLDRYTLVYNIRRIALGPAPGLNNKPGKNASLQTDKVGQEGAA
jgi:hypothetical protein